MILQYITLGVLTVAFTVTTALRIIGKLKHKLAIRPEDYLILFATVSSLSSCTLLIELMFYLDFEYHCGYLRL